MILQRWEPSNTPAVVIGGVSAQGGQTQRYWVLAAEGTVVRERPWGRVLTTKRRGFLLRLDAVRDGWGRLEADFTEDGQVESAEALEEDTLLLEGWVLLDGRDLGLPRQCQKFVREKVPPAEEARRNLDELAARRAAKHACHAVRGEDFTLAHLLREAKVSDEVIAQLASAGVDDLDELIAIVSRGDHHEELRRCGISKLGARAKLATLVQPYWKALSIKEQGNAQYEGPRFEPSTAFRDLPRTFRGPPTDLPRPSCRYKDSRFEDAAALYSRAIEELPCSSTDLALNCYANRAACFQQMREPRLALTDVQHVLRFDPTNAKALARRTVYENQVAGGM